MIVVGLTGSVGMGKSVLAEQLTSLGVPVHESDAAVHDLLAPGGGAEDDVKAAFPNCIHDGAIDRKKLGSIIFHDDNARKKLESILHPKVRQMSDAFIAEHKAGGADIVVLDIPLLFETHQEDRFDHIICVTAPAEVQKQRVLARPGMTEERFKKILDLQMPDAIKRDNANTVIDSAGGKEATMTAIKKLIAQLKER